jgi:hypothetical protein
MTRHRHHPLYASHLLAQNSLYNSDALLLLDGGGQKMCRVLVTGLQSLFCTIKKAMSRGALCPCYVFILLSPLDMDNAVNDAISPQTFFSQCDWFYAIQSASGAFLELSAAAMRGTVARRKHLSADRHDNTVILKSVIGPERREKMLTLPCAPRGVFYKNVPLYVSSLFSETINQVTMSKQEADFVYDDDEGEVAPPAPLVIPKKQKTVPPPPPLPAKPKAPPANKVKEKRKRSSKVKEEESSSSDSSSSSESDEDSRAEKNGIDLEGEDFETASEEDEENDPIVVSDSHLDYEFSEEEEKQPPAKKHKKSSNGKSSSSTKAVSFDDDLAVVGTASKLSKDPLKKGSSKSSSKKPAAPSKQPSSPETQKPKIEGLKNRRNVIERILRDMCDKRTKLIVGDVQALPHKTTDAINAVLESRDPDPLARGTMTADQWKEHVRNLITTLILLIPENVIKKFRDDRKLDINQWPQADPSTGALSEEARKLIKSDKIRHMKNFIYHYFSPYLDPATFHHHGKEVKKIISSQGQQPLDDDDDNV